jgi:2,3-diketo-5-methylthio-1-phosphopentane phosphatase
VRPPALGNAGAILLDIEGTTTSVSFVTSVLFPYARRLLRSHLEARADGYESLFSRFRHEHVADADRGEVLPPWEDEPRSARVAAVAAYAEWLMDRDRKSTALKELQGHIWEDGYRRGELVGDVFPDVRRALERWHQQNTSVGIFSSGSVLAQQLLFRHSAAGDLTRFLRWYFDTRVGTKIDPESYRRIAADAAMPADAFLFLSDVPNELAAARSAGMQVRLVVRPGNAPVAADHGLEVIHNLDEVV